MIDLEALEALAAAATPGPWKTCGASDGRCACNLVWSSDGEDRHRGRWTGIVDAGPHGVFDRSPSREEQISNAAFIAAARDAVPELVAEVRRLRLFANFSALVLESHAASALESHAVVRRLEHGGSLHSVLSPSRSCACRWCLTRKALEKFAALKEKP